MKPTIAAGLFGFAGFWQDDLRVGRDQPMRRVARGSARPGAADELTDCRCCRAA